MNKYSKLWGAIGGYVVGAVFAGLAVNGMATCTDPAVVDTCTVFGVSPSTASRMIEGLFVAVGTYFAPKNA